MTEIINRTRKITRFTHTNTKRFGGYVTYWKLYIQLWGMLIHNEGLEFSGNPKVFFLLRIMLGLTFILKTPWWLIFKPLGYMFSVITISKGTLATEDGKVVDFYGDKDITYKFLGLTYWHRTSNVFTQDEMDERAGLKD